MSARRVVARIVLTLGLIVAVAGCVTTLNTYPPPGATPKPVTDEATAATVATVIGTLDNAGLEAAVALRAFRPSEGPLLAAAPRTVIEVKLPNDPAGAFIVVYAFATPDAALAAAEDDAAYLAAGIGGGVQYPPGTRFTLQVTGSNVLFFSWLVGAPDSPKATIETAVRSLGTAVEVVR